MEGVPRHLHRAATTWRVRAGALRAQRLAELPSGDGALREDDLIVFPSNEQLSLRAHGMPASTLRRHLAGLVDAGLDHSSRQSERQTLRAEGQGRGASVRVRLRSVAARRTLRRVRAPGGRNRSRSARRQTRPRADHALPARHRQDDCHGHRGGRSDAQGRAGAGRLAGRPHAFRAILEAQIPRAATRQQLEEAPKSYPNLPTTSSILLETQIKTTNLSANESQI